MVSRNEFYPDHLNPFGDEEDEPEIEVISKESTAQKSKHQDDYPDYLSPFGEEDENTTEPSVINLTTDDYDDSLNPFGCDTDEELPSEKPKELSNHVDLNGKNVIQQKNDLTRDEKPPTPTDTTSIGKTESITNLPDTQPIASDCPPKPLPRTKSLLKKELAQKSKQSVASSQTLKIATSGNSDMSSKSSDIPRCEKQERKSMTIAFQRKKNKRNAPPVPINFKRQVFGSINEIESELVDIDEQLKAIEDRFKLCKITMEESKDIDPDVYSKSESDMKEILDKKNSISERQKQLNYRKRELVLDQIHSDIEYELRMIGNKQCKYNVSDILSLRKRVTMQKNWLKLIRPMTNLFNSIKQNPRR